MSGPPLQPPPKNLDRLNLQEQMKETGRWMFEVYRRLKDTGILAILWTNLDFTGSKLTDIITRAHADLQLILGLDPTSTDATKNKHVSNAQGKKWEDHVDASANVHGIGVGSSVVGTATNQTLTTKTIDGDDNTLKDIGLTSLKTVLADANKVVRRDAAGVVVSDNALPNSSNIVTVDATQTLTAKTVDKLSFQLSPTITPAEGDIFWDDTDKTLCAKLDGPSTVLQIGQEQHLRATNKSGSDIANAKVVYIDGAQGSRPTIKLAKADADATSHAIGMTTEAIDNNLTGYVTTMGLVRGADTSAWVAGTTLYLSAASAGELTSTSPSFPSYAIKVACVIFQDATDGILLVHPGIEPANHVVFNHLGAKDAQFGDATNYTEFEADGTMQALGTATCWDDSQVPAFDARTAAAQLTLANLVGGLYNPRFDINDEIFGSIQLSHRIKTTGTVVIKPHIHLINQNTIGATGYNVKYEFEWAWANLSSTGLSTATNDPLEFSFQNTSALTHKLFSFTDITAGATQGGISSYFLFRLKRVAAATEPYNTNDIFFAGFDIHFEVDMLGSRDPAAK